MGEGIEGRFGISLSLQQSSDLEKTQTELRQRFTAVEKFRRELEFLQEGGNPLDLTNVSVASISVQSTSLTDQHLEQIVTSEPHGDSVGSSGRLPNSADNLVLFNGDIKFRELEIETKSIRSPKSNLTPIERCTQLDSDQIGKKSGDYDALGLPKKSYKRRVRSRPNRDAARSNSCKDVNGLVVSAANTDQNLTSSGQTNGFDSESSCVQISQTDELTLSNEKMEQNLASSEVLCKESNTLDKEKEDKILKISDNEDGSVLNEDGDLKRSESDCQNELKNHVLSEVDNQNNLNLASKELEETILNEARIIEAKRKRIAELSPPKLPLQNSQNSHWDFVLEEMSWLANDFAQERLWKITAAAQISKQVAFASQIKYQIQNSSWKQKEVAQTLSKDVMEFWHMTQVKSKELDLQCHKADYKQGIQEYAMRFLEYNSIHAQYNADEVKLTPDIISDEGIMDISMETNLTEENLMYTVPLGAIEAYRKSIESHLLQCEGPLSSMQEDVDTSGYDAVTDNNAFEEDDEEQTKSYYLPGAFEGNKLSKSTKKRFKKFKFHISNSKSHPMGPAFPSIENQPSGGSRKRPGNSQILSLPSKHVRTGSRQRVVGPFNSENINLVQTINMKNASSGGTNSFQDEDYEIRNNNNNNNNMEAESAADYKKQFDSVDVSDTDGPRKKKKTKHPGSSFGHRWKLDSNYQNDQRDHSRRRDAHRLDSNGSNVTSQMSNLSNHKKFMELIVRDGKRISKTNKITSGSPWSLFEDQFLVVLVHDMWPNWELISDAINNNSYFKRIFRSSKECKERHKVLMGKSNGEGADSAEDSGSSQPYPYILPGIPEGSARQLFQRLQGPLEEETLKSHFEKIIIIGRKQFNRRIQSENQELKQVQQPHSSYALALSQVFPNNLNGGIVLTPLDLCDAIATTPAVATVGFQGSNSCGLTGLGQAHGAGASNVDLGNDFSSASFPLNRSVRDMKYGIPKTSSMPKDEKQRIQLYKQMLSARNSQHSSLSPGSQAGTDESKSTLPNGNRNMNMATQGFCGLSSGVTTPTPANMHPRAPPQAMHLIRPNGNSQIPADFRTRLIKERQLQQQQQQTELMKGVRGQLIRQNLPEDSKQLTPVLSQPHQQKKLLQDNNTNHQAVVTNSNHQKSVNNRFVTTTTHTTANPTTVNIQSSTDSWRNSIRHDVG